MKFEITKEIVDTIHKELLELSSEQREEDITAFRREYPELSFWWIQRGGNPSILLGAFFAFKVINESLKSREVSTDWCPDEYEEMEDSLLI